ncbi:MAG TPA: radical SAM family heme chaperone HemW [Saprospiraceae bacterium]|nr:radical SAM family heme chaperone HemW [Saprospiraceae bacterium]
MAGLYIHFPFCKQACHYCNFHFSTSLRYKGDLIKGIQQEIKLRAPYLEGEELETIYFGGGTPSLLSGDEIQEIFKSIKDNFKIVDNPEVTLEANPDDLTEEYIADLRKTEVNRLSIGVQSFFAEDLIWMNRAHNPQQAHNAIKWSKAAGFNILTIDLIYGSPTTSNENWLSNIETAINYGIEHISSYCLTVEEKTPLFKMLKKGESVSVSEEHGASQFSMLMDTLEKAAYEQYEISNFAKNKQYARHNTAYWQGKKYLGIGPSAHSFNGESRSWNIANNNNYIKSINEGILPLTTEILTEKEKYNELVMTGLRTMWGVDINIIKALNPDLATQLAQDAQHFLKQDYLSFTDNAYKITMKGKFLADRIASDLFLV